MKLYEYMAKELLAKSDIPIPRGEAAFTAEEAAKQVEEIGPAVLKSQVLIGGRGKAGGIQFASSKDEGQTRGEDLLGMSIRGEQVQGILVEEQLDIDRELYLSITVDAREKKPLIMASTEGGVEIEEVPDELIIKRHVDPKWGVSPYVSREIVSKMGLTGATAKQVGKIIVNMFHTFKYNDCELVEINPLVVTGDEKVLAADAKITIDDDASFRHKELPKVSEKTPLEEQVEEIGLSFVELDGDIGIMANGAGMAMATVDVIQYYGGNAANFLDAGGGASVEPTKKALEILLNTNPNALIVNIFGGITRCDDVANALVQVKDEMGLTIPLVIRLVGTNDQEGIKILEDNGIKAFQDMGEAAREIVRLAEENKGGASKGVNE